MSVEETPVTLSPESLPPAEDTRHLAALRLPARDVLFWLVGASAVGVAGSALLENARLAGAASLGAMLAVVPILELAFYLLALRESRGPRLPAAGIALALLAAAVLRAGLALLLAVIKFSPLAAAGLGSQFQLYYLRLWPAALVQILAVAIFLWLIRDSFVIEPYVAEPPPEGSVMDRRELLDSLLTREATPPPAPRLALEVPATGLGLEAVPLTTTSPSSEPLRFAEPMLLDPPLAEPIILVGPEPGAQVPDEQPERVPRPVVLGGAQREAEETTTFPTVPYQASLLEDVPEEELD